MWQTLIVNQPNIYSPLFLTNKTLILFREVKKQSFSASLAAKVGKLTFLA